MVFEYDFERVDEAKGAKDEEKIPGAVVKGYTLRNFLFCSENISKKAISTQVRVTYGTNVVLTLHLPSNLFAARGEGGEGPPTNWKASGRFPFVWLPRRRRPFGIQYT